MGRYFKFEYVRCDGKLMRLSDAEDMYGYEGVLHHCGDIEIEISVYGETWKDAARRLKKLLREVISYEDEYGVPD